MIRLGSILRVIAVEQTRQQIGDGGSSSADEYGLDGTAQPARTDDSSLEGAEDGERNQSDDHGEFEGERVVGDEHVWEQGDESAGDVGEGDGERRAVGAVGSGLLETELKAHHEVDPGGGILLEGLEHRRSAGSRNGVLLEDMVDFLLLVASALDDLTLLSLFF